MASDQMNQGAWQLYSTTTALNQGAWQGWYDEEEAEAAGRPVSQSQSHIAIHVSMGIRYQKDKAHLLFKRKPPNIIDKYPYI